MKKLPSKAAILMAVVSLFATSSVAMAAEGEEEKDDTVFNFGYDPELKIFVWGASSTDGELDCTLEDGEYAADYLITDGLVMVDQLYGDPVDPVTFPVREDEGADPVAYTSDGECALGGGLVAGPEGQVNHGMFLRLFNSLYEGTARGCVIRHIAQSDLGKGDQQLNVEDVDPDAAPVEGSASGTLDLTSVVADCERGSGNGNGNGNATGRPESPGKSGSAPGKNPTTP